MMVAGLHGTSQRRVSAALSLLIARPWRRLRRGKSHLPRSDAQAGSAETSSGRSTGW